MAALHSGSAATLTTARPIATNARLTLTNRAAVTHIHQSSQLATPRTFTIVKLLPSRTEYFVIFYCDNQPKYSVIESFRQRTVIRGVSRTNYPIRCYDCPRYSATST